MLRTSNLAPPWAEEPVRCCPIDWPSRFLSFFVDLSITIGHVFTDSFALHTRCLEFQKKRIHLDSFSHGWMSAILRCPDLILWRKTSHVSRRLSRFFFYVSALDFLLPSSRPHPQFYLLHQNWDFFFSEVKGHFPIAPENQTIALLSATTTVKDLIPLDCWMKSYERIKRKILIKKYFDEESYNKH